MKIPYSTRKYNFTVFIINAFSWYIGESIKTSKLNSWKQYEKWIFIFKLLFGHPKKPWASKFTFELWNCTSGNLCINENVSEDGDLQPTESIQIHYQTDMDGTEQTNFSCF